MSTRIAAWGFGPLLAALLLAAPAVAGELPPPRVAQHADFGDEAASRDARHVADWALDSANAGGLPFAIVDKVQGKVFVFDAAGVLAGAAPALVGLARGDESVPGIGSRKMSTIREAERTTPAGRFVAVLGKSLGGDDLLWVDYEAAVALHRVIATVPKERRLQRLESRDVAQRRITYGCINVPSAFFDRVVVPMFRGRGGIVYVLPETRPARDVFGAAALPTTAMAQDGSLEAIWTTTMPAR
jgi:hypothetical protein